MQKCSVFYQCTCTCRYMLLVLDTHAKQTVENETLLMFKVIFNTSFNKNIAYHMK